MMTERGVSIRPSDAFEFPDISVVGLAGLSSPAAVAVVAPDSVNGILGTSSQVQSGSDELDNPTPITDEEDDDSAGYESAYKAAKLSPRIRRLTDIAIVTELVVGSPVEVIAKNYHVDAGYVSRIRGEWLKACKLQEAFDYRHDLKLLSLEAIRDGLKAKSDPFKRMQGGIRVMQGIGEFKPDQINVAVLQRIENVPAELRDRFLTSTAEDEGQVIEAQVVSSESNP